MNRRPPRAAPWTLPAGDRAAAYAEAGLSCLGVTPVGPNTACARRPPSWLRGQGLCLVLVRPRAGIPPGAACLAEPPLCAGWASETFPSVSPGRSLVFSVASQSRLSQIADPGGSRRGSGRAAAAVGSGFDREAQSWPRGSRAAPSAAEQPLSALAGPPLSGDTRSVLPGTPAADLAGFF